ncbi:MAG: hypothetical protein ACXVB1_00095 [Pseudobdellovibrionaceae bacterium]
MRTSGFYVAKAAILNPSISSFVAKNNEFDDGVQCFTAEDLQASVERARMQGEIKGIISIFCLITVTFAIIFLFELMRGIVPWPR